MKKFRKNFDKKTPSDPQNWWLVLEGDGHVAFLTVPLTHLGPKAAPDQLLKQMELESAGLQSPGASCYLYNPTLAKPHLPEWHNDMDVIWDSRGAHCSPIGIYLHHDFTGIEWERTIVEYLDLEKAPLFV